MFQDRIEAGRQLAARLRHFQPDNLLILAIPRGGVVVAAQVARALRAPIDLIIPRKIGAPGNPELAIGAVAGEGNVIINEAVMNALGIPDDYIEAEVEKELGEIERRRRLYLGGQAPTPLVGRAVIIVDDGLATGSTALAAIRAVRAERPDRITMAVPVAPLETVDRLAGEVDELVCLATPEPFYAVGQFYYEFHQVTDEEVIDILSELKAA